MLPHQATYQAQPPLVDAAQAEAAVVGHYSRLARLAYLLLPCTLAQHRRVRIAHALTQRALPLGRTGQSPDTRSVASVLALPGQRRDTGQGRGEGPGTGPHAGTSSARTGSGAGDERTSTGAGTGEGNNEENDEADDEPEADPGYAYVRVRVVRGALEAGLPRRHPVWSRRLYVPLLPVVWGLRLVPHPGGAREHELDRQLSALPGPARAACLLRTLERLTVTQTRRVLAAAGVTDPDAALATAATLPWQPATTYAATGPQPAAGTPPQPPPEPRPEAGTPPGPWPPYDAPLAPHPRSTATPTATHGTTPVGPAPAANGSLNTPADTPPGTPEDTVGTPEDTVDTLADTPPGPPADAPRDTPPYPDTSDTPDGDPAAFTDRTEHAAALLASAAFDPCCVQAQPTDLLQRRQRFKTALVSACAVLACGALLGLPGQGGGQVQDALAESTDRVRQAVLDPGKLIRVAPATWRTSSRTDYSVWPARGALTGDRALLRRALTVWARPDARVRMSLTPGTPAGPPPGPAQLLYAGQVHHTRVVLLHDGLRIVRYAEPAAGGHRASSHRTALDLARTDSAGPAEATALMVTRGGGSIRYLTAPWVRAAFVRDLLNPSAAPALLHRFGDGVTAPMPAAPQSGACRSWPVLQVRDSGTPATARPAPESAAPVHREPLTARLLADLGEPVPAHLTAGPPTAPGEAAGPGGLADWAHLGCALTALRAHGVRSVNSWRYARERLPEANGTASWLCTRADTWRGTGNRVLVAFRSPGLAGTAVVARGKNSPACGRRTPQVLAGVLWRSTAGHCYLLAAGSRDVASIATTGTVHASTRGHALAVPAKESGTAGSVARELAGRLTDGTPIAPPH
jgi:hypothetical protein